MKRSAVIVLACMVLLPSVVMLARSAGRAASGEPSIFAPITLEAAKANAAASGKLLVVNVWATWCPPCLQMRSSTWRDQELEAWIGTSAVAIAVDADGAGDQLRGLHVTALPTILVFGPSQRVPGSTGGGDVTLQEVGRIVGFRTAPQLVAEFERLLLSMSGAGGASGAGGTGGE